MQRQKARDKRTEGGRRERNVKLDKKEDGQKKSINGRKKKGWRRSRQRKKIKKVYEES